MTAALLLALAACGNSEGGPEAPTGENPPADATAERRANRSTEESVAAVQHSPGTPLATLRYTVPERPVAGQPFALQLSFSAAQPVAGLQVKVESDDLTVTPESAQLALEGADEVVVQELVLTAQQAGLSELTARISGEDSRAETVYAIPVLVVDAP